MEPFLVRLLIGVLVIVLVERIVAWLKLNEWGAWIINGITLVVAVLYIVFGYVLG